MTERPAVPAIVRSATANDLRKNLRAALAADAPLIVPGVTDAMAARLAEQANFEAVYVTGAGMANAEYGLADVGLVSMSEVVENVGRLTAAVDTPVIVDADTGYGGPLMAMRSVSMLERIGVAAIQLEDQEMPKRCGHFDNHALIPAGHMQSKLDAVLQARQDEDLVIIARTDARSAEGSIDAAIERGHKYREAGADAIFIEAPRTVEELELVGKELAGIPLVVNVVEGGKTPEMSVDEYADMGFSMVLYANYLLRASLLAQEKALVHLASAGRTDNNMENIATWQKRQALFRTAGTQEAELFYDLAWDERP